MPPQTTVRPISSASRPVPRTTHATPATRRPGSDSALQQHTVHPASGLISWTSGADIVAAGAMQRRIVDPGSLQQWQRSSAYKDVVKYISELCDAIAGKKLTATVAKGPFVDAVCGLLDEAGKWIEEFPPQTQAMRYGNTSFRQWHGRMCERALPLMQGLLTCPVKAALPPVLATGTPASTVLPPLPASFVESALCTRVEYLASLALPDTERAALELAARAQRGADVQPKPVVLATADKGRAEELAGYFAESFGNATRIDYGSGHELAFLVPPR